MDRLPVTAHRAPDPAPAEDPQPEPFDHPHPHRPPGQTPLADEPPPDHNPSIAAPGAAAAV